MKPSARCQANFGQRKSANLFEEPRIRKAISSHLCCVPQDRWQELTEDIELGKISSALALEPKVRARLEALMKPDPERAAQLRAHFLEGFRGIAKRLWPHLHLVLAVDSGSNEIYGEMLRENYCQGVPFYSPFYAATEGGNQHSSKHTPPERVPASLRRINSFFMVSCRSDRSEPVAPGAKQTLFALSQIDVLRVPP